MGLIGLVLAIGCLSCNTIWTDQSHCPKGVSLAFNYSYNMEYVNSFTTKVHCLSVYVFDERGQFVDLYEETSDVLSKDDYRMELDLDAGRYTLLAFGGIACPDNSFDITSYQTKSSSNIDDMLVTLRHQNAESDKSLHNLFYGALDVEVPDINDYVRDTLYMMKNTNNIRLVLQQVNGKSLSSDQFAFSITDRNTRTDKLNNVVSKDDITYRPWAKGEALVGTAEDGETPISVAYAELSTNRLTVGTSPKLRVQEVETGEDIINIPLNNYLLLLKSELYSDMGAQEFLDRESEWSLVFFLDDNLRWVNTRIIINDWVVRINHTQM